MYKSTALQNSLFQKVAFCVEIGASWSMSSADVRADASSLPSSLTEMRDRLNLPSSAGAGGGSCGLFPARPAACPARSAVCALLPAIVSAAAATMSLSRHGYSDKSEPPPPATSEDQMREGSGAVGGRGCEPHAPRSRSSSILEGL
ncbi:hypothetical protein GUITHDRAFT_154693 [Guillardia theta CCMP2712]|uniref:Uncharacterized protein n=1 Tax=Guillardia theta (strain CCMP2712) TaxID=905079 RepID=L1IRZ2_GUITC|nr:hypothetical protein GUITHDRAFT_154693 [Guillardia theta CCMP2712]EKX38595.1 hypothetical protein GUITHDRAFT_154693 [Guillardia theta CCMP2712]|eukprot:XP_005825575.1 hypothetical protein GUITHDRAFT_154693 [Guillardia theta CCMP2712]